MNKNDINKMVNDPAAVELAAKVFCAMTKEAQVKEHLEPLINNLITELNTKHSESITKKFDLYLASEQYFFEFIDKAHEIYISEGYTLPEKGYCPILMAETKTREARNALIDYLERYTKITYQNIICSGLDNLGKYIELNLKLFAPIIKPALDKIIASEGR